MLRRLRHKLAMIRYYSAPRRRTRWSRAQDAAFFASFFLALPAAVVANYSVIRHTTAIYRYGVIYQGMNASAGTILAAVNDSDNTRNQPEIVGKSLGNFYLTVQDDVRGWPLPTSVVRLPARLDLDLFSEMAKRNNVTLEADSPYRAAIEAALVRQQEDETLAAWISARSVVRQNWLDWGIAAGTWWILLTAGSWCAISLARFTAFQANRRAHRRRIVHQAEGRCHSCGYDMTGLEFNERCPECGQLVM